MSSKDPLLGDALRDLTQFLEAIRGYLNRVVLCGGWAPYFYRSLPLGAAPAHGPLLTHDFDFVAPSDLPLEQTGTLHEHLLRGNFVAIRNREPPVAYYQHERWGETDLAPVYGEFLTPLTGSGRQRGLHDIQDGVAAQQLRYLDLLLYEPLTVQAAQVPGLQLSADLVVQVPNPAAFILQKALALKDRKPDKRPKDLAYVFEVATLWFYEVERVRGMIQSISANSHDWGKWVERGGMALRSAFLDEYANGPVSAEHVFRGTVDGHHVTAERVVRVVHPFLEDIFS